MLVLDLIRRSTGISRVELVSKTGLSTQTMSNICRRLSELDLIQEAGRRQGDTGAPSALFEVNPDGRFAIGLHIDPARLTFLLLNLAGDSVRLLELPTPDELDPVGLLDAIVHLTGEFIATAGVDPDRLAGLGVATPGPIDASQGTVVGAPNLPGWELVRLRDELQTRLGLAVVIEKDSTAAALGEQWANLDSFDNFAYIYLGTGASAGIVLNGEVVRGASSNMGDIGHLSADPNAGLCPCGLRGCLATTSMPAALVAEATAKNILGHIDIGDARAVEAAMTELCRKALETPQGAASAVMTRAARNFARVAAQLVNLLDLEAVVFGGPQWTALEPIFMRVAPTMISQHFVGKALHPIQVLASAVPDDAAAAYGAASMSMWSTTLNGPGHLFLTSPE